MQNKMKIMIRVLTILIFFLLAIFLFIMGKQHDLIIDNSDIEYNGKTYKALKYIDYQVDKNKGNEIFKNERLKETVMRSSHKISINGEEYSFKVPIGYRTALLNLPLLIEYKDNPEIFLRKLN